MYSGLLPKGLSLTDAELSSDDEDDKSVVKTQEIESISKCLAEPSRAGVGESCESVVKTGSSCTPPVIEDLNPQDYSLPGISHQMWQKFKGLQKKNDEVKMKLPRRRQQRKRRHQKDNELQSRTIESNKDREPQAEHEKLWDGLEQYFGINDKFHPPACSKPYPKSGLEKSIESAIAEGDFGKAEEMSDRLATRELAVKIAQAADCRDFVQSKQEAGASQAAQKRKEQIAWGFEAKRRWETKSNMGYM